MLGTKIRNIRKNRELTVSALADQAGVSESYISQLESGRIDPSVSLLRKLAVALEVPIAAFFDAEYEEPVVTRKEDCQVREEEGVRLTRLTPEDPRMLLSMTAFSIDASSNHRLSPRSFYTCLYVTEGKLNIQYPGTDAVLSEGDSIFIPANTEIRLCNPSEENPAEGLLCVRRDNRENSDDDGCTHSAHVSSKGNSYTNSKGNLYTDSKGNSYTGNGGVL
ncbi:MAG: helix-turn-helix domain-containing protein [Lachnospiraceae bacterium]|nr:helix-turn-helix domain-containing protein [Lachnospiraceae bacterium]